jgi:hypothetical protein
VRQLISKAITPDGEVIDVFTAAGLQKPVISILPDQFRAEVRGLKHKHAPNHSPDGSEQRRSPSLVVRPDRLPANRVPRNNLPPIRFKPAAPLAPNHALSLKFRKTTRLTTITRRLFAGRTKSLKVSGTSS